LGIVYYPQAGDLPPPPLREAAAVAAAAEHFIVFRSFIDNLLKNY
jgi:hypothetical protein